MAKASKTASAPSSRDTIIQALMALMAEKPPTRIGLAEIADKAGVSLAQLRGEFGSWFDIFSAYVKSVDTAVLEGLDPDLDDQDIRERLFDILMRRLDVLGPHKAAIRSLFEASRRDGNLSLALNRSAVRSMQWMLAGAGVDTSGPSGALKAQGLAVMFARVITVWLDDEDPALARTMKAMDEGLARAGRAARMLGDVERLTEPLRNLACSFANRRREKAKATDRDEEPPKRWRGDDFRDPQVTPV